MIGTGGLPAKDVPKALLGLILQRRLAAPVAEPVQVPVRSPWDIWWAAYRAALPLAELGIRPLMPYGACRAGERRRPATPGEHLAWSLTGPRGCVGLWTGDVRIGCPSGHPVKADGPDAQCSGCAARDPGRALARDAALGQDDRDWNLYLAWFGPGLVKVGLTAADRGRDRLLEQGAITYTLVATGRYGAIRRAERSVSASGLARERISAAAKATAWWTLPAAGERAEQVAIAHASAVAALDWSGGIAATGCHVYDLTAAYGLDTPPPATYHEVTGLDENAVMAGRIRSVVGRRLLLDTSAGPLLADMRRIAGHPLSAVANDTCLAGLRTVPRTRPQDTHENDQLLF